MKKFCVLLCLLISACGKESKNVEAASKWSLEAPIWYSPSTGESRSFEQFQSMALKKFLTDDVITFKEGPSTNISLQVTASCSIDNQKYQTIHKITLPEQLSIFQVLPSEAWLDAKIKPICSLQFLATNSDGSMHFFDLQNLPLDTNAKQPELKIQRLSDKSGESQNLLFRDRMDQFFFYSRAAQKYQVICEGHTSNAIENGGTNMTRMIEFQFIIEQNEATPKRTFCRLVEISATGLVTAYSENFYIFSEEPMLTVDQRRSERLRFGDGANNNYVPLQTWRIKNSSDNVIHVALPNLEGKKLTAQLTFKRSRNAGFNMEVPIKWAGVTANKNNVLVMSVPAQNEVTLQIAMSQRISCRQNNLPIGIWSKATAGSHLTGNILLNPDGDLSAANILGQISLHLVESRWIGRPRNPFISDADKQDFDDFSSLPVTPEMDMGLSGCRLVP